MPQSFESTFPEEIIDRIMGTIGDQHRSTLYNLCLVSKKISRIATAHLYEHVSLDRRKWILEFLLPLTHLILSSPRHASLVRFLSVPQSWDRHIRDHSPAEDDLISWEDSDDESPRSWPQKNGVRDLVFAKIKELSYCEEDAEMWMKAAWDKTNDDAILAILIPSLPNLRYLMLNVSVEGLGRRTMDMLKRCRWRINRAKELAQNSDSPIVAPLAGITTVQLNCNVMDYFADSKPYATFLHLPGLKHMYSYRIGNDNGFDPMSKRTHIFDEFKPRSSSVETIEMRYCQFVEADLVALFKILRPGTFKEFIYKLGFDQGRSWSTTRRSRITEIIGDHKETLERLALIHDDQFMEGQILDSPVELKDFIALEHLRVSPVFIWGDSEPRVLVTEGSAVLRRVREERERLYRILPRTLKELIIDSLATNAYFDIVEPGDQRAFYTTYLIPALAEVIRHVPNDLPQLKRLAIRAPLTELDDDALTEFGPLMVAAVKKGLEFELIVNVLEEHAGGIDKGWGWNGDVQAVRCEESMTTNRAQIFKIGPWCSAAVIEKGSTKVGREVLSAVRALRDYWNI